MTEWAAKPRGAGLSADEFSAAVSAVTSAFGDPTRRDIYLFVRAGADGVTAGEVAERFDLHPNVARHHLEKLAAGGYLTVELSRHESAGRPSKRYRVGELDTSLTFPPWPTTSATSTGSRWRRGWSPPATRPAPPPSAIARCGRRSRRWPTRSRPT